MSQGGGFNKAGQVAGKYDARTKGDGAFGAGIPPRRMAGAGAPGAGGAKGKPCQVEGIEFPVLRIAQVRQGKQVTANAISRDPKELPPDVKATGRWGR